MAYKLKIAKQARDDLAKLDKPILVSVHRRLKRLADVADEIQHQPLKGRFTGLYKLRVRKDYRIIYDLNHSEQVIVVVRVGHRSDIYDE